MNSNKELFQPNNIEGQVRPNFLLVGASKAGSTSLYQWLKRHPDVFMPDWKEPQYFNNYYGLDWQRYTSLFQPGAGKKAIGEASTVYLADPMCAERIKKELGDIKIVMVLRNPVDRCFSLYTFALMFGYEWIETFDEALAEEDKRFNSADFRSKSEFFRKDFPFHFWDYMYFRIGLYHDYVKQYLDLFSQVKIYLFEDLVERPMWLYTDLCRFLQIDDSVKVQFNHHNATIVPKFIRLQHILRKRYFGTRFEPAWYRQILNRIYIDLMAFNKSLGGKVKMTQGQRDRLKEAYRSDVIRLGALIGKDLSHWVS